MNITIYTISYNEEKMLPFFLDHYSKFASKIVVYDNESTDDTVKIAKSYYPLVTDIKHVSTKNTLDDRMYLGVRNHCWTEDTADYVMLVDADELIYCENIVEYLQSTNEPVHRLKGYDMVSENFPKSGSSITSQIKQGLFNKFYCKPIVFNPSVVKRTIFNIGMHDGKFYDKKDLEINPIYSELKLLHYKNLGFEYINNRHNMFAERMCDFNRVTGSGSHYLWDKETHKKEFDFLLNNSTKIIP